MRGAGQSPRPSQSNVLGWGMLSTSMLSGFGGKNWPYQSSSQDQKEEKGEGDCVQLICTLYVHR